MPVAHALSPGDIAFTGFNADGDDDFAIVALTEIPASSTHYFTENKYKGTGGVSSGERAVGWNTGG